MFVSFIFTRMLYCPFLLPVDVYLAYFLSEKIFTRKKEITEKMKPEIKTFIQDMVTLKGDISSIFIV